MELTKGVTMSGKLLQELLKEVDLKKAQLDALRPLPGELINELNKWFKVELTYSSTALEGNRLTSDETAMLIEKDLSIDGKSLIEHLVSVGHADAFEYILDLAKCNKCDLTLPDILNIHKLIFDKIDKENIGVNKDVELSHRSTLPPYHPPLKFHDAMNKFMDWLHNVNAHPVLIAAEAHFKLITLQPFAHGNGVAARLLMNLLLMQKGYEPAIIWPEDRDKYIKLIANAQESNDLEPFYEFIIKQILESFDLCLERAKSRPSIL